MCKDLLQLIRETENDDLTCALQRFVCTYSDEIAPLAIEVTKHLVCRCSITHSIKHHFIYFIVQYMSISVRCHFQFRTAGICSKKYLLPHTFSHGN